PRPCTRPWAAPCVRPSASRATWCPAPRGSCDGGRRFPSPLGGEGGSRSETDEGDVDVTLRPVACGRSPLIRAPPAPTFSPEGRRKIRRGRRAVNVTLIGYGSGNVASVRFALERLGARVRITDDPADVDEAERIILPGVGAAGYAMQRLKALDLIEPLRRFQRPLLGVCLGQQLLCETSAEDEDAENGGADLLGLIPGRVEAILPAPSRPSPHMGWSRLTTRRDDPLLDGVKDGDWAYFVHGYVCP